MNSNKRILFLTMLGLVALVIAGCSGGDGEAEATSIPTVQPGSTAAPRATSTPVPAPTAAPAATIGSGPSTDTGTLEVRVTDAPDPSITAVYVTTSNIEGSLAGQGWVTIIDEEITFELLALEGVEAILGTAELPVGRYAQIRFTVPEVQIEQDGEIVTAEVPGDTIRLVGPFELEADKQTFISLDFDVEKSLVDRGRAGFLFKPVIKMAVGEPGEAGSPAVALTGKPAATPVPPAAQPTPALPTAVPATATPVPPTATPDVLDGAFFLHMVAPEDGEAFVSTNTFEVIGRTSLDALVTVNDTFADVAIDGTFSVIVELDEGPNVVEVVASTAGGDEDSIVLVIIFEPAA